LAERITMTDRRPHLLTPAGPVAIPPRARPAAPAGPTSVVG
jgi:hypothetical protein